MGFFRKKEEKKKFDYSDDTKELFAERDAFYARMRQEMGGGDTNPELANQKTSRDERPKEDDLGDLLGDSDFNPYANKEEVGGTGSIAAPSAPSSGSAAKCQSCGKEFQSSEFSKCPMCGGDMKKVESAPPAEPTPDPAPVSQSTPAPSNPSAGDPLDDLLGDFNSPSSDSPDDADDSDPGVRMVNDDLGTDFGASSSSHSPRKVRKVKKVKRPRKSL